MQSKYLSLMLLLKFNTFLCVFLLAGCNGVKVISDEKTEISYEKITSQSHGGMGDEKFVLVKSSEELKQIFTQVNIARKPGIPLPIINFNHESIIALFMGQQTSGGYSISIESVKYNRNNEVQVCIKKTEPSGMSTMAITQPFSIYKLNKKLKKVTFINID